jgi:hypothetical protein
MRRSAWPFSHACAMKTASSPKTTAKATITIVDLRTTPVPNSAGAIVCALLVRDYRCAVVWNW